HAFHLCHTNPVPQLLTLTNLLYPRTNTMLQFKSRLGYATSNQVARVQVSANGNAWTDIFTQAGSGGSGETNYSTKNVSLGGYAGVPLQLRFNYDYGSGSYYPQTGTNIGWFFDEIIVTNANQLLVGTTNSTATTNFLFNPPAGAGDYILQARALIFTDFPLAWGPAKEVSALFLGRFSIQPQSQTVP